MALALATARDTPLRWPQFLLPGAVQIIASVDAALILAMPDRASKRPLMTAFCISFRPILVTVSRSSIASCAPVDADGTAYKLPSVTPPHRGDPGHENQGDDVGDVGQ
jgi:hypothetical protein